MDEEKNNENNESSFAEALGEKEITIEEISGEGDLAFSDKIKKVKDELEKCRKEKEEYLTGWQRAKADLINARKDDERKMQEFSRFANASLISEIMTVLDSFDLALAEANDDSKFSKGVFLIKMQLEDILKRYGLEHIKTIGEKVDFNLHETVGEIVSDKEDGVIVEEVQKGYALNGKVLRPARVKISKNKER